MSELWEKERAVVESDCGNETANPNCLAAVKLSYTVLEHRGLGQPSVWLQLVTHPIKRSLRKVQLPTRQTVALQRRLRTRLLAPPEEQITQKEEGRKHTRLTRLYPLSVYLPVHMPKVRIHRFHTAAHRSIRTM